MRTVRLVVGFQGTHYEGWQSQRKGNTLQEVFEKILEKVLKHKAHLVGSSRTDSGVHAIGFAAHFRTANPLPDKKIKDALNFYLPRDVVVFSAKTVSGLFHARFSARGKLYRYDIWRSPTRPLFEAPFVLWHPGPLDAAWMKKAAKVLTGRHDFSAFRGRDGGERNPVKNVRFVRIRRIKRLVRIEIEADGFLRHMARIIVGTLIEAGRKKISPEKMAEILHSKDRAKAGPTAKAYGLTLVKVKY
ncbi:MAG: tRNA pseudouridine(38-40) synthase TruA [Candidatus Omnitrophica bacterium]|nr:tRNA pseudouridine(38-40) synthase TruA [Candidatus Omnitrophota bacterium]